MIVQTSNRYLHSKEGRARDNLENEKKVRKLGTLTNWTQPMEAQVRT